MPEFTKESFAKGGSGRVYELADALGASQDQIFNGLILLGLAERAVDGTLIATEHAMHLGAWHGDAGARFLGGGRWSKNVVKHLGKILGNDPTSNPDQIKKNRVARRRAEGLADLARLAQQEALAAEAKRLREIELSKLTGIQRVNQMVEDRTRVMRRQYDDDSDWERELLVQRSRALSVSLECSFDDSYPDFETELWDRVTFTLDELVCAANKYVAAGRALPERELAEHRS